MLSQYECENQMSIFDLLSFGITVTSEQPKEESISEIKPVVKKEVPKSFKYAGETITAGHFLNPYIAATLPIEDIDWILCKGSGFENGKKRIIQMVQTEQDLNELTKKIKDEYGQGGAGWPLEGYGIHGYETFGGKGIKITFRDEKGENVFTLPWKEVAKEIKILVEQGFYF